MSGTSTTWATSFNAGSRVSSTRPDAFAVSPTDGDNSEKNYSFLHIYTECPDERINKKRLSQFQRYSATISSLCFNDVGTVLAIACSYVYELEEPPENMPEDNVFIRHVTDQETKPNTG
ncbi:mitotic checkpoint protein BUB3-like [Zootermopsis nevadensis]|uniref:mitotic checkpoint protein BUB3-like n=1 Tax=Zootermopsis nevadensis TaxID=136037 RepID=UPI000B8E82C2|nr:mitotic checkpoint protein BUB3-like [Zootermopsis nevadensis]